MLPGGAGKGSDANATTGGQGDSDEDSDEDGGKDAALLGKRQGQEPDVMPCYKVSCCSLSFLKQGGLALGGSRV